MGAQAEDAAGYLRFLEQAGLTSVMNNTKWEEFVTAMRTFAEGTPEFRAKDVRGPEPSDDSWDGEWYYHLHPFRTLEWVEIRCIRQVSPQGTAIPLSAAAQARARERLADALPALSIPFSIEGKYLRVWGYVRPGLSPAWVRQPGREGVLRQES